MTQSMLFTVLIPAALLAVLGIVLLGNRLSATMRRRVEMGLALVFYPALVVFWVWRTWAYATEANVVFAVLTFVTATFFAIQGAIAVRQGRLIPASRRRTP